jgi:anaerobic selenocysteine-containing dehydrogenase
MPAPPPAFPLRFSCAKTVAYCHSQHRNIASLRRLAPHPGLEMPPEVAAARNIKQGDWVRISTPSGTAVARAHLVRGIAPGTVFGQHGWWVEGPEGTPYDATRPLAANINRIMSTDVRDPVSGSIPLRSSWCQVERLDGFDAGAGTPRTKEAVPG